MSTDDAPQSSPQVVGFRYDPDKMRYVKSEIARDGQRFQGLMAGLLDAWVEERERQTGASWRESIGQAV